MAEPITVRAARLTDRDNLWPLVREFATSFAPDKSEFDISFASVLSDSDSLTVVAIDARRRVVGYLLASSHPTFFANRPVVWVEEIMVTENARRAGIGAKLMAAAEAWSLAIDSAYVSLATRRAGEFYRALGYEESATFFRKLTGTVNADAGQDPPRPARRRASAIAPLAG